MKAFSIFIFFTLVITKCFSQSFYDTSYHANGKIRHYGYHDKQKDVYLDYHFYYNGNLQFVHQYDSSNFLAGDSIRAYNTNGTFALQMVFKKGRPHGYFKEYYSDGIQKKEGQYYEGFINGDWKEFHKNGKLSFEYHFIISKKDSAFVQRLTIENFDPKMIGNEIIDLGEADSTLGSNRFDNLMRFKYSYFLSTPDGIWKKYDTDGTVISSIIYKKRRKKAVS